jgi:hypothetical protein
MGLVKISCLTYYLQLFASPRFRIVLYYSLAFVIAMTIATIFSVVYECLPIESNWVLARMGDKEVHQSSRSTIHHLRIGFRDGYWSSRSVNEVLLRRFWPLLVKQSKLTPTRIPCIHLRKNSSRCFMLLGSLCVLIPNLADQTLTPHAGRAYRQSSDSNGSTTGKTTQNSLVFPLPLPRPFHSPPLTNPPRGRLLPLSLDLNRVPTSQLLYLPSIPST